MGARVAIDVSSASFTPIGCAGVTGEDRWCD
jgi:hypothetical protein